jgi:hypothetical protein
MQKSKKTAVLQPQYEQVAQLWRSYGCCLPTQPKLSLKCRVLVLSPQTTLPELPGAPKPRKNQPASPPGPQKMPRKIAKAARPIFQNWKARSHIKRSPNKLGYKRETPERRNNPLEPESIPSLASQETALRSLLIFRYRWATQKSQQGDVLKFLGKRIYPEKVPSRYSIHE